MTVAAFYNLSVDGAEAELQVRNVRVAETMHAPFRIRVLTAAVGEDGRPAQLDPEALLGGKAKLSFSTGGHSRTLAGVLVAVEREDNGTLFVLSHPVDALADTLDHRLFLDQDSVEIAKQVLSEHAIEVDVRVQRALEKRPQCVQAFESDLDFVSRVLSEDGVCWHVDQRDGEAKLVFADNPSAYDPIDADDTLAFGTGEAAGMRANEEVVFDGKLAKRLRHDKVTLRDWDFEHPDNDLTAAASHGDQPVLERYEYPGAGRYVDKGYGEELATLRLDQLRRSATELSGRSTCGRLAVGRIFTLKDAPRQDMNGRWLVVKLEAEGMDYLGGEEERRFVASFVATPADEPFRPNPPKPPSLGGVQNATVTGPGGEEIHTDEYGRVRTLFRWDRRGKADETSSHWMRPIHPPTSGGFMLPRVGWEVLMGFSGPSGDRPYVLGRLDNGAAPPAENLPAKKVRSNFGTPTTPGGGSGHMLRTDDTAGKSVMTVDASKNYNEKTTKNKKTSIDGIDKRTASSEELIFDSSRTQKVDSAQSISVGAARKFSADGGMVINAGSELVAVGGTRELTVLGDYACNIGGPLVRCVGAAKVITAVAANNRHVNAASTVVVGGAWLEAGANSAVNVMGPSNLTSGATNIKTGKYELDTSFLNETNAARTEKGANITLNASVVTMTLGATTIRASNAFIVGKSSVTINAGGAILEIKPGSVTVTGSVSAGSDAVTNGKAEHE